MTVTALTPAIGDTATQARARRYERAVAPRAIARAPVLEII